MQLVSIPCGRAARASLGIAGPPSLCRPKGLEQQTLHETLECIGRLPNIGHCLSYFHFLERQGTCRRKLTPRLAQLAKRLNGLLSVFSQEPTKLRADIIGICRKRAFSQNGHCGGVTIPFEHVAQREGISEQRRYEDGQQE